MVAHDLLIAGVAKVAGDDDEIRLEAFDLAAQVVERRDDGGLDGIRLELRVESDRGLDVGEGDEDFQR
ncbi:MAG TPA: hypothetical protein VF105_01390 [Gemmatimonadaceae bacterium]